MELFIASAVLTSWIVAFWAGFKYGQWALQKAIKATEMLKKL